MPATPRSPPGPGGPRVRPTVKMQSAPTGRRKGFLPSGICKRVSRRAWARWTRRSMMAQSVRAGAQAARVRLRAWLAPAALLLLAGCGEGKGDISGVVKVKGDPLPFGKITFTSENKYHKT